MVKSMKNRVFVVIHDFYSHDMFVVESAKQGHPEVFGIYGTSAEAEKHIRPWADDSIEERTVETKAKRRSK